MFRRPLLMAAMAAASGALLLSSSVHAAPVLEALQSLAGVAMEDVPIPAAKVVLGRKTSAAGRAFESVWETMLSEMSPALRKAMRRQVLVSIVPRDHRLIDDVSSAIVMWLPPEQAQAEIEALRRSYAERMRAGGAQAAEEPRGYAKGFDVGGEVLIFCFVGEENLAAQGDWDENGARARRVLVHELGHAVWRLLPESEAAELRELFIEYVRQAPDRKREYDEDEAFAECTEIWFGVHQRGPYEVGWDAREPFVKLAGLMRFVRRIYGPSRNVR